MHQFYEKRPRFTAVQFDGTTDTLGDLMAYTLVGMSQGWVLKGENNQAMEIEISLYDNKITLRRGDWLVKVGETLEVIPDHRFQKRFEAAK